MISSRKDHIIPMYVTCCITIALIIAWTNVEFFEAELKEQDIKVFSKIKELNKNKGEINSSYMNRVEEIILDDDLVIIYDYDNNKVIDSINVVVGDQFEEQVHKSIEINSKRIRLDRDKQELHKHTYIQNINLKIDDIPYDKVEDRYLIYYIPRWMVRENYMLTRLLQALTISCFFSAITVLLFDKQIKKLK
ncbi:hypothetical protein [Clostridium sp.]|uniref:hypothetical protein n=1 Tax=Clostridium sp. TaxID=1506 RepID=UPI001A3710FA|nr:hypothetical protein [Clostridium sp.]MBK5242184.1 hypothetical protein [Clostridium sp.]